jgi:ubiquinone/menaquinone biosynthesis C-methylase UbiE
MKTKTQYYNPKFNKQSLIQAIHDEYTEVACNRNHKIHFISGRPLAKRLGYPETVFGLLPEEAIRPFAGVGNPFKAGSIRPDEILLDIGCGAGFDIFIAWLSGARNNTIYGLDITEAMVQKARENTKTMGANNIKILKGSAENIPLHDASIDVVISNGVINLCTDKIGVYKEIYRVLKPGGRFQIADVLLRHAVPDKSRDLVHLWTNCVAGGVPMQEYKDIIHMAGFKNVRVMDSFNVFKDARIAKSAASFGAKGHNVVGYK